MAKRKKVMSKGKMAAVGAGVAALSAGAYYLLGPNKKAHQKKAKKLVGKVERAVVKDAKLAKKMAGPIYKTASKLAKNSVRKAKARATKVVAKAKSKGKKRG